MEQKFSNILKYRPIAEAADEIVDYINGRRTGIIESLKTRWKKFNRLCMGGIEPNTIYTIAGISGAGKSSFMNSLETDLVDLNPNANFVVLSFNYEMLSSRQVGRKLSYKLKKTTSDLYSGNRDKKMDEDDYNRMLEEVEKLKKYPIYYVDVPGNVENMRQTIFNFYDNVAKGKWLIIILDHTLLTRGRSGDKERETLAELQYMFMEMKKYGKNTIIQLSQMNREIESVERLNNNFMHFPMRRDVFGGDSIFQASDYVIVLHRPELLSLRAYGPYNWPTQNLIYMHFLKNREGDLGIIPFENNLKFNRMDEADFKKENSQLLLPI